MQAHFLLGPAGSGKTFRCLAEIRAELQKNPEGPPLVLLAPKQATFQLERQLLADPALHGYTRLQIFSFERLAQFVLNQSGVIPPDFLSDEGRVMVLRALLTRHANELKLFRGSARRLGFAQELARLLKELQQHQLTPVRLHAFSRRSDIRTELSDKLHDLALLLEKYDAWLLDRELQDANHLLDFAIDALRKKTPNAKHSTLNFGGLWLDGFAEMTPQELDLLTAVVPVCARATLAFCLDESGAATAETSWLSIWSAVGKSFQQCRERLNHLPDCTLSFESLPRDSVKNRFAGNPALRQIEAQWSQPCPAKEPTIHDPQGALSRVACSNAEAEAVLAAREILKFVRAGNRFRDCAILMRHLDDYHKQVGRIFRRYGIPFFLDRREAVAHHPLAELTRGALRTVAFDWEMDDWFAALKAGFSPIKAERIDELENAALEFGWRGKKWREPLPDETSEQLRKLILPPFENFFTLLGGQKFRPTGGQLADALRELWSDLKVEQTLESWGASGEQPSQIHSTIWIQMNAWLDSVALAFSTEPLPLREWLPILEAGLANLTVGAIPPSLDQVLVGAIDRARNPDLKLCCVLGLNETIFPATPEVPAILTDSDRDELAIPLGPNLRERLARERYYGYIACTRASERLVLTYARQDVEGKTLNPSSFIAHLQQIFPALATEEFQNEIKLSDAEHANEIVPLLAGMQNEECRIKNWPELLQIPALKILQENLRQLREPDPKENLSPVLTEKLFGPTLRSSVSRLEEFAACPFRFFVRSGLRADERKVFELDARERGNFQHDVLKAFHDQLMAEGKRWRDLEPAEACERIGKITAAQTEHFRDGLFRDSAETVFVARALAESLQDFVAVIVEWLRGQNDFDPAAAELGFGGNDDRAPAWEIKLGDGHKLSLHGRIDRVDLWRDKESGDAFALVLDYKSSSKKLDRILVENGVQLQLLAYLNVLRHWKNPREVLGVDRLIPAGVFYVDLRGEYKGGGLRAEILADADEARRMAYRHTGRFDAGILDKLDRTGAADQFNYRRNNDDSLRKGSVEAMSRGEFEKLLDGVETQLREMGERIFSGEAKVDPYRKGKDTPCEFCDYQAVCRIDKWTHQFRVLRPVP